MRFSSFLYKELIFYIIRLKIKILYFQNTTIFFAILWVFSTFAYIEYRNLKQNIERNNYGKESFIDDFRWLG